jgi:hypothetical protein
MGIHYRSQDYSKICLCSKTHQYNQADETPFGLEYLGKCVGISASAKAAEAIPVGTFQPSDSAELLPEPKDIIQSLGTPISLQPYQINREQFKNTYKIVKENRSSSPSGRNVGHYKQLIPS